MKQELIDVVRKIRKLNKRQEEYVDKLPVDIQDMFLDNAYVNDLSMKNDILMSALFGPVVVEDIFWFIYEYKQGSPGPHVTIDSEDTITFNTDEDFYKYLEGIEIQ